METTEIKQESIQEQAHGLIHEIAYNVRIGEIEIAQTQIKMCDELLHIMCDNTNTKPVDHFNDLANLTRPQQAL